VVSSRVTFVALFVKIGALLRKLKEETDNVVISCECVGP
jgi:hypothetical protein